MNLLENEIKKCLVENKILSKEQIKNITIEKEKSKESLIEIIIKNYSIEKNRLYSCVANWFNISFVDLNEFKIDTKLSKSVPEKWSRKHEAIFLEENSTFVLIGVTDPTNFALDSSIEKIFGKHIKKVLVERKKLLYLLDSIYESNQTNKEIYKLVHKLDDEIKKNGFDLSNVTSDIGQNNAPVMKLLQKIFDDAIKLKASDIHFESIKKGFQIRLRIDGILYVHVIEKKNIFFALVQRLKLMAKIDISEKMMPQDGRFSITSINKILDVRMSVLNTTFGQSVVMRLLDKNEANMSLEDSGMTKKTLNTFKKIINNPHGMVLVTGPTGCGKTSTLYAALDVIDKTKLKVITIEDPVEAYISNAVQVQTNSKIGLEFSNVLRASLRQDPDVIMVGEIRDTSTATIAVRAALTGHMVLSTLHTNNSISTVIRLINMGIDAYLVAFAMRGVISQRLLRKLCNKCKTDYLPQKFELDFIGSNLNFTVDDACFKHSLGCEECNNTGYKGRTGVYELLEFSDDMCSALRENDVDTFSTLAEKQLDRKTILNHALYEVVSGFTTINEIKRVGLFE